MLRRKQHLMPTRENPTPRPNAKVTVQYIQPQRQPSTNSCATGSNKIMIPTFHHDEEIKVENMEFAEEAAHGEDLVENQAEASAVKVEDCEDVFYPNAILCLLDLYKDKYENVIKNCSRIEKETLNQMWRNIAKEMQESYFEFEAEQIRQKYLALRQKYFNVRSRNDMENFEYFEQMHEIYKDPRMEILTKSCRVGKMVTYIRYKDEDLVEAEVCSVAEISQKDNLNREEIVHKEHEFIDIVEKELQAMADVNKTEKENQVQATCEATIKTGSLMPEKSKMHQQIIADENMKIKQNILKRPMMDKNTEEPVKQRPKIDDSASENLVSVPNDIEAPSDIISSNTPPADFTLFNYNEQQERRHREQLQLLRRQHNQQREQLCLMEKSLKLHEKTLEQQNNLLQELIKRFPTT